MINSWAVLTQSGNYFDLFNPDASIFGIDDIAHGLAMICRFSGQCARFYSVAEHSLYVSYLVPDADALAALLHDAPEAFLGDVISPLKAALPRYRALEAGCTRAISQQFGLPYPLPDSVKKADLAMLATEQRALMRNSDDWGIGVAPLDFPIAGFLPDEAKARFLARFYELEHRRAAADHLALTGLA